MRLDGKAETARADATLRAIVAGYDDAGGESAGAAGAGILAMTGRFGEPI